MRVDLRSQRADLRPERADLRPGRGTNGMTDGRTNKSPPMFYRTSSPSGPLPKKGKEKERGPKASLRAEASVKAMRQAIL